VADDSEPDLGVAVSDTMQSVVSVESQRGRCAMNCRPDCPAQSPESALVQKFVNAFDVSMEGSSSVLSSE
jgi:hypothetical protein